MDHLKKKYEQAKAESEKRRALADRAAQALAAADPDDAKKWDAADGEHRRALAAFRKAAAAEADALEVLRRAERAADEARLRVLIETAGPAAKKALVAGLSPDVLAAVKLCRGVCERAATAWEARRIAIAEARALADKLGTTLPTHMESNEDVFTVTGALREVVHESIADLRSVPDKKIGATIVPWPTTLIPKY